MSSLQLPFRKRKLSFPDTNHSTKQKTDTGRAPIELRAMRIDYRARYGPSTEYWITEDAELKTGFTPIFPPTPGTIWTPDTSTFNNRIWVTQRKRLSGFTTDELFVLGALPSDDIQYKPSDLCTEYQPHPMFDRARNWDHREGWAPPIVGREGHRWTVARDDVWEMVQPALVLASMYIDNIHTLPW
jgi:hypothetical protein